MSNITKNIPNDVVQSRTSLTNINSNDNSNKNIFERSSESRKKEKKDFSIKSPLKKKTNTPSKKEVIVPLIKSTMVPLGNNENVLLGRNDIVVPLIPQKTRSNNPFLQNNERTINTQIVQNTHNESEISEICGDNDMN